MLTAEIFVKKRTGYNRVWSGSVSVPCTTEELLANKIDGHGIEASNGQEYLVRIDRFIKHVRVVARPAWQVEAV